AALANDVGIRWPAPLFGCDQASLFLASQKNMPIRPCRQEPFSNARSPTYIVGEVSLNPVPLLVAAAVAVMGVELLVGVGVQAEPGGEVL
ncbi:MAG: hypothetical protein QOI89_3377, partial [Solirubrobacteraceae bacterium]|nr:hypothetical protein [Solirubrobacteraceae bacterium]